MSRVTSQGTRTFVQKTPRRIVVSGIAALSREAIYARASFLGLGNSETRPASISVAHSRKRDRDKHRECDADVLMHDSDS